jgi:hypothetical protein
LDAKPPILEPWRTGLPWGIGSGRANDLGSKEVIAERSPGPDHENKMARATEEDGVPNWQQRRPSFLL